MTREDFVRALIDRLDEEDVIDVADEYEVVFPEPVQVEDLTKAERDLYENCVQEIEEQLEVPLTDG